MTEEDTWAEADAGAEVDAEIAAGEEIDERAAAEGEEEAAEEEGALKDAPDWVGKRIGKLTAKRHEADERRARAEAERDEARTEAETVRKRYGDRDVLSAAKRTGLFPELLSAEEGKLLNRADALQDQIDGYDENPEGWETAEGRTVTAQMVRSWRTQAVRELREIQDEAAELRGRKAKEVRDIFSLGLAAKRGGGKPEVRPAEPAWRPVAIPPKADPLRGKERGAPGAGVRRSPMAPPAAKGKLSEVKTREDLLKVL